jgi:hypothetical protein
LYLLILLCGDLPCFITDLCCYLHITQPDDGHNLACCSIILFPFNLWFFYFWRFILLFSFGVSALLVFCEHNKIWGVVEVVQLNCLFLMKQSLANFNIMACLIWSRGVCIIIHHCICMGRDTQRVQDTHNSKVLIQTHEDYTGKYCLKGRRLATKEGDLPQS